MIKWGREEQTSPIDCVSYYEEVGALLGTIRSSMYKIQIMDVIQNLVQTKV